MCQMCMHQLLELGMARQLRVGEMPIGEDMQLLEVLQGLREQDLAAKELGSAGRESQGSSLIEDWHRR
jgi:hypothetical protein